MRVESEHQRSESDQPRCDIIKTKSKTNQQLLFEMEKLRTRLDATERRLQEANELLQAQIADRKRGEETFEKAQKYAENIVETIREPLLVLASDLRVLSANRSFYDTFKVTLKETIGNLIYNLGNREWDIPRLRTLLEDILTKNNKFDNYEVEHVFSNIGHKIMLLNARRIIQKQIGSQRILLAIEDITERRRLKSLLEGNEAKYRELVQNANSIILKMDPEGKVTFFNEFAQMFFGYTEEEMLGRSVVGTIISETASSGLDPDFMIKDIGINPEKFITHENENMLRNGERVWVAWTNKAIRDGNGKVIEILCIGNDITERRRLEILLSESEERYRRLFETANDGILLLEKREGNITHANPAVTAMLGYSKEECIGNKLQDIGFSHDMGDFQEIMRTLDRSGIIYYDDVPIKTKAGQTFYVDIYLVDRARLVQCNIRDITERKQTEEVLRKSERELKSKTENLEEVNSALNVLLKRVEEGRIELEEKILSNIRELVLPYIARLKKTQLSGHQASYLIVIETNLDNIASSFLYHLKMRYLNLTHREVQVASLVKEGKSTKEIAELLNIAIKTVVFHRNSLRKKLGLKNQKANLRAHLLTFT
jgi:PAS domain S-box-containing protein